ncbi:MAG: hypothetical protein BroJett014_21370 [Planctomycetota bacterium]|nr:MAG: hypothetical protein BroJett014_21370 [Planctomycetota bacterium]
MQLETDCLKLLNDGRRFLPELAPFAEADVPDAKRHLDDTYDRLERLTKAREMNYNLWALARIREAESSEGNKFGTCRLLVREIDEQRLSPWVLERFTQIYKKLFEELSDSDKVLITRARILGRLAD